jgi:hypothetical protein
VSDDRDYTKGWKRGVESDVIGGDSIGETFGSISRPAAAPDEPRYKPEMGGIPGETPAAPRRPTVAEISENTTTAVVPTTPAIKPGADKSDQVIISRIIGNKNIPKL